MCGYQWFSPGSHFPWGQIRKSRGHPIFGDVQTPKISTFVKKMNDEKYLWENIFWNWFTFSISQKVLINISKTKRKISHCVKCGAIFTHQVGVVVAEMTDDYDGATSGGLFVYCYFFLDYFVSFETVWLDVRDPLHRYLTSDSEYTYLNRVPGPYPLHQKKYEVYPQDRHLKVWEKLKWKKFHTQNHIRDGVVI